MNYKKNTDGLAAPLVNLVSYAAQVEVGRPAWRTPVKLSWSTNKHGGNPRRNPKPTLTLQLRGWRRTRDCAVMPRPACDPRALPCLTHPHQEDAVCVFSCGTEAKTAAPWQERLGSSGSGVGRVESPFSGQTISLAGFCEPISDHVWEA